MAKIAIVYKNPVADKNRQALRRLSMELRKQAESAAVAHEKTLENLKTALTQLGLVATWFERNKLRQSLDRFALVISLGGDGTFIHTSHFVSETLLLGINSAPEHSVGHYCRYALRT
ncbi:MAG: hypothetical protein N2Z22_05090, partial [Turneriella sp.]|nr:hypothetical protein [Turneriella sp.]